MATQLKIQITDAELETLLRKLIELEEWQTEMICSGFMRDEKALNETGDKVLDRCAELSDQARALLGLPSIREEVRAMREAV